MNDADTTSNAPPAPSIRPAAPQAHKTLSRNTLIGLVASIALAAIKFLAGAFGHSSALIADAVESLADTVGSLVVWQSLRVADRPADREHPYGHGKAEALATLCVGGLLFLAAGVIVARAVNDIRTPHEPPKVWTLFVLVAVIVVKEGLFRVVLKGANEHESDAARADAWHHRADAITSAAAFLGVAIAIAGTHLFHVHSLVLADEVAAMVASIIIVLTGINLVRPAFHELLDGSMPDIAAQVRTTAASIEGVRQIEKIYARKSGRGYHVDMHMQVDPDLPTHAAHAIGGKVRAHVRATHPCVRDLLIHIEPDDRKPAAH